MAKSFLDEVLTEADVDYVHLPDKKIDDQIERSSWKRCTYIWKNIETGDTGERTIAVRNQDDALKLINHWNRTKEWKYILDRCKGG